MGKMEVVEGIYWVGTVDWDVRLFHGFHYSTPRGTSYNSYLILDEKKALVDTVYSPFAEEMLGRIGDVIEPADIDYLIINHTEVDHSGSLRRILDVAPNTRVICGPRAVEPIKRYFKPDRELRVVKNGEELKLGKRTLRFVEAPILHWPDTIFTYVVEDGLLLPNDAFGQHIASLERWAEQYNSEVVMRESARYFVNIVSPYSRAVLQKLDELGKLGVEPKLIAPSHGLMWRNPSTIVEAYSRWAKGAADDSVIVLYDTMWKSTEMMARSILDGVASEGLEAKLFFAPVSDWTDVLTDIFFAKGLLVGSSTINNGMLPHILPFLDELRGLRIGKGKLASAFGSYGWSGEAVKEIIDALRKAHFGIYESQLRFKWRPEAEELRQCYEFGRAFARAVKEG